jgi:hypothetical protein
MSIIDIAESDLSFILEDSDDGFGVPITVTLPDQTTKVINGQSTDIGLLIDPSTGVGVRGRNCEVVFRVKTVLAELGSIPSKSVSLESWLFSHTNTNGETWLFALEQVDVDRKLGIVKMLLGLIEE